MRLFEHADFEQAITRAAEHFRARGLRPAIIEKDYYYYDLYQLTGQAEVTDMLRSDEYGTIKADYDQISRAHFEKSYFFPEGMSFANSDALFPPGELAGQIEAEYEKQCQALCYGSYPAWSEVQDRFEELRHHL